MNEKIIAFNNKCDIGWMWNILTLKFRSKATVECFHTIRYALLKRMSNTKKMYANNNDRCCVYCERVSFQYLRIYHLMMWFDKLYRTNAIMWTHIIYSVCEIETRREKTQQLRMVNLLVSVVYCGETICECILLAKEAVCLINHADDYCWPLF